MLDVTIIITTYLEQSKRFLDLCMQSIANLNYDKDKLEILIVSKKSYMPQYEGARTIAPELEEFYPAHAINFAMRESKPSKYFFILNDDTIVAKDALKNLVEAVNDQDMCANAISPCDNGVAYNLAFAINDVNGKFKQIIGHQFKYEDLAPHIHQLMNAESVYSRGYICMPYLCIFATLIPRKCYEMVGDWDENFKCGQDDLDYSWRAHLAKFQTVAILDALVWHFSGVTAESTLNLEIRRFNVKYFKDKWGKMPPGIPESFIA